MPGVGPGAVYKYHVASRLGGYEVDKADPFAFRHETPPRTGSVVWGLDYAWGDREWMGARGKHQTLSAPGSTYEVHLGSWRRDPAQPARFLTYRELAPALADYVEEMGFTHVELLPVMEHPFYGSWGYQSHGLLRPHQPLRHAPGPDVPRRHPPPARHRRDPRLGAVPLPDRRARPRLLRRHAPLRARRPAPGPPPRLGQLHLQLRPPRGPQLPARRARCSGSTSSTPTACASTPWRRCSTSTTRARRASGCPTTTAAARTSRPSTSCAGSTRTSTASTPTCRPSPRSRPRGPWSRARSTWAASASASSGTWAGCTTPSPTSRATPSTASTTTTS